MKINEILSKNETESNIMVASVMLYTFLFYTAIFVLNLCGIFTVNNARIFWAYIVGSVIILVPALVYILGKIHAWWYKYLFVGSCAAFVFVLTTILSYHAVILMIFPVAVAGFYYKKRIMIFSLVLTTISSVGGQILNYYVNVKTPGQLSYDANYNGWNAVLLYAVLPRTICLVCMSVLLWILSQRAAGLVQIEIDDAKKLEEYHNDVVSAFADIVENRDENTGGHIKRTSRYVEMLAQRLKEQEQYSNVLTDEYVENIVKAAPLHDIGKISISDSILQKPGKLTSEEFDIMKTHSAKGAEIIEKSFSHLGTKNFNHMAYEVARFHHEKWSGRGYPEGRMQKDIPLAARIMAIADVFDAVSQKRCYRDAMPLEECFAIIQNGSGKDFDPDLVRVFMSMKDEIAEVVEMYRE